MGSCRWCRIGSIAADRVRRILVFEHVCGQRRLDTEHGSGFDCYAEAAGQRRDEQPASRRRLL
jgi:hypothetical protein